MNVSALALVALLLVSTNLGLPVGMPPAPEDPMMARLVPDDVLLLTSWAGVLSPDPDADPTQKWMAKDENLLFLKKLRGTLKSYGSRKKGSVTDKQMAALKRLFVQVSTLSQTNATTIYVRGFEAKGDLDSFRAAAIVALKDQQQKVVDLMAAIPVENVQGKLTQFSRFERNGIERISYVDRRSKFRGEVAVWNGYFIIGVGEGELDEVIANAQTVAPDWYLDYRRKLPVEKFCSMSYVAENAMLKIPRDTWVAFDWNPVKSFRGMFMVSGLDERGMVTRGKVDVDFDDEGIEKLIQVEPLEDKYFRRLPERPTLSASVGVSIDEVIQELGEIGEKLGEDPIEQADQMVRDELGVGLKEELLDVLDGFVGVHYTLDIDRPFTQGVTTIGIAEEMSFSALHGTVLDSIRKWDRKGEKQLVEIKHGLHEIYSFPVARNFWGPRKLVWANVDEELIIGSDVDSVKAQIDRGLGARTFVDTQWCQELIQFGKENQFGNPIAVSTIDLAALAKEVMKFLDRMNVGDRTMIGDLKFSDIPDVEVLTGGVQPNVMGLYRDKDGFQIYIRQTIPGASPVTTLVAAGAIGGVMEMDRFVVSEAKASQNNLRQLALACLNFESARTKLPATGTKDNDGNPLLSWRVHVLPLLGEQALYKQFHLDEPWDSPNNKKLIARMPEVFRSPGLELEPGKTVYLGVAGKNGPMGELSDRAGEKRIGAITDGTSNSVLIVECGKGAAEIWTKPADLSTDGANAVAATKDVPGGVTNIVTVDGSVHQVKPLTAEVWARLLNMRDGKTERWEELSPAFDGK